MGASTAVEPVTVRSAAVPPSRENGDQLSKTLRSGNATESVEMPETAILELKQQIGGLREDLRQVRTSLDSQLRKQSEEGSAHSEMPSVLRQRVNSLCEELADCGAEALKLRCNLGTQTSSSRSRSAPGRQASQLQGFVYGPASPRNSVESQVFQAPCASGVMPSRLQSDPRLSSGPSISSYLAGALSPRMPHRLLSGVSASPSSYRVEQNIVRGLSGMTEPLTVPSRKQSTSSVDPRAPYPSPVAIVTAGAVRAPSPGAASHQGLLRNNTGSSALGHCTPEMPLSIGTCTANSSCKNSRASLVSHGQEHGTGRRFKDSAMKAKLASPNFLTRMLDGGESTAPTEEGSSSKWAHWPEDLAAERLLQREVANQLREMAMLRADNARLSDRLISAGFDASETPKLPSAITPRQPNSPRGSSALAQGGKRRSAMEPVREGSVLGQAGLWHKPGRLLPKEPSMPGGWSPSRTTEHWTCKTPEAGLRKSKLTSSKARR